uniref:Putative secreted protein n=1 Tax=Anopheles darlingi TaxID=43151 RepID=A0A2M4D3U5_ANODA
MQCFLLDAAMLRVQVSGAEVRLGATANILHQLGVDLLRSGHRRQVVRFGRRHEHTLRFRQLVTLVDRHVRLEVLH